MKKAPYAIVPKTAFTMSIGLLPYLSLKGITNIIENKIPIKSIDPNNPI